MSRKSALLTTRVYQWRFLVSDIFSQTNVARFSVVYNPGAGPVHHAWTVQTPFLLAINPSTEFIKIFSAGAGSFDPPTQTRHTGPG